MKLKVFLMIVLASLIAFSFSGCSTQPEQTSEPVVSFEDQLTANDWDVDILGLIGTIRFDKGEVGTLEFGGQSVRFSYTISNVTDNDKKADLTLVGTGIKEIDGEVVHAQITEKGLKVTYSGMSYTLTPVSEDSVD